VSSTLHSYLLIDPLKAYSNFVDVILNSVSSKSKTHSRFPSSQIWWNEDCTKAIQAKSIAFHVCKNTHYTSDFCCIKINVLLLADLLNTPNVLRGKNLLRTYIYSLLAKHFGILLKNLKAAFFLQFILQKKTGLTLFV